MRVVGDSGLTKGFRIVNTLGLHARAAANFVRVASRFSSDVKIRKDSYQVDGKSILGVLSLAAVRGSEIYITVDGDDSREALEELGKLIESGFGEGLHDQD